MTHDHPSISCSVCGSNSLEMKNPCCRKHVKKQHRNNELLEKIKILEERDAVIFDQASGGGISNTLLNVCRVTLNEIEHNEENPDAPCPHRYPAFVEFCKCLAEKMSEAILSEETLLDLLCDPDKIPTVCDKIPRTLGVIGEGEGKQLVLGRYEDPENFSGFGASWQAGTHLVEQGQVLEILCYEKEITCDQPLLFNSILTQAMPCFFDDFTDPENSTITLNPPDTRDPDSKFAFWLEVTKPDGTVLTSPPQIMDGGQPRFTDKQYLGEADQPGIYKICIKGRGIGGSNPWSVTSAAILSDR